MKSQSGKSDSKHSPLIRYTRSLLRRVNRAFSEFGLITEGDRVCTAVSGGKDSLSLLHLLIEHRRFFPNNFEIRAVHTVSDYGENTAETKTYLTGVFESFGIPYDFIDISVTTDEHGNEQAPTCFWCAWNRRKALFKYCAQNGYNKLAFGHHFDDVAETTLMNLVYHGSLETMLPRRSFFDGKFEVIRPLFFVRERELARLAKMADFHTSACVCPNDESSKRRIMKNLVRDLSPESKYLHYNLWRAAKIWHDTFGDHPLHPEGRDSGKLM